MIEKNKKPMIKWDELKNAIDDKIGMCYFNGSRTELIMYCPYCEPNSKKNHGHLYVKMDEDHLVFNCFKGEERGSLVKLLKELELDPKEFLSEDILNKKWDVKTSNNTKKISKTCEQSYETKGQSFDNELKKQYVLGRLGYTVDLKDIPNLVFDVNYFLKQNNIKLNEQQESLIPLLESNFVGFIGVRGSVVVFRNIDSNAKIKHYKLYLNSGDTPPFKDFYGKKTGPIESNNKIVLCEGQFDLLVSINSPELKELKDNSCLWAAIMGKSYVGSISSILDYCCLSSSSFAILSDPEVEDWRYKKVFDHPQVESLEIYRNKTGEDFGCYPIVPSRSLFSGIAWRS